MALDELIDDRDSSKDDKTTDSSPDSTKETVNNLIEQSDVETEYNPSEGADFDKEYKCCVNCLHISKKQSNRYWECTNSKCGFNKFTMSYYEHHKSGWNDEFLSSIDWVSAMKKLEDRE